MKRLLAGGLAAACLAVGAGLGALPGEAADHLEAPAVAEDGRTDINDLYVFPSPENPDNTVLIMTVNPLAGVRSPTTLDPGARYTIRVDNDGDARSERSMTFVFGEPDADGRQAVTVRGAAGNVRGTTGTEIALRGDARAYVGTFDDPFFFDFVAFQNVVKGAGGDRGFCESPQDFFAGANVTGIVIEVPTAWMSQGASSFGVWAETIGRRGLIDTMGRPGIATVLIDDGSEDSYNRTRPRHQRPQFGEQVADNLQALSGLDGNGYSEDEAGTIADILIPDILTIDTGQPVGYLNGRALDDDVIDTSLFVVTGGLFDRGPVLTEDCVDANDRAFPGVFPYLAPAH